MLVGIDDHDRREESLNGESNRSQERRDGLQRTIVTTIHPRPRGIKAFSGASARRRNGGNVGTNKLNEGFTQSFPILALKTNIRARFSLLDRLDSPKNDPKVRLPPFRKFVASWYASEANR